MVPSSSRAHTHTLCPMCTLWGLFPPCTVSRAVNTSHAPAWVSQSTAPRALLMSRLFEKSLFSTTLPSRETKCNVMCCRGTKTPDLPCPPCQVSPADVPRQAWLCYLTASSHPQAWGCARRRCTTLPVRHRLLPALLLVHTQRGAAKEHLRLWKPRQGTRAGAEATAGWLLVFRSSSTLLCSQQKGLGG